jgi:regulator of protease activity HflC (stomatin/prohibitin superfamily)
MSDVLEQARGKLAKLAGIAVLAIVGLILTFGSFEVVGPSERAVKVTLGTAAPKVYGPGAASSTQSR